LKCLPKPLSVNEFFFCLFRRVSSAAVVVVLDDASLDVDSLKRFAKSKIFILGRFFQIRLLAFRVVVVGGGDLIVVAGISI
jgi:hypothetical protein